MKKMCFLFIVLILFFTSCSLGGENMNAFKKNDESIANNTFETVINTIKFKDNTELEALFSKVAQSEASNLGENSIKLFVFIQGDIVSFSDASEAGVGVDYKTEQAKKQKIVQSAFYLETSVQKYYIAIKECTKDDFDNSNVGVISIYIIKSEDWDEDYIYRCDGKLTPGINIME